MTTVSSEVAKAIHKAQSEIEGAKKGKKNEHFKSKYADLTSVWEACREALSANGLAVIQMPTAAPPGSIGLRTVLLHTSGESVEDTFYMPLKDPTNPQAAGSAITYARRYALAAFIGICPEDDDGNAAATGRNDSAPCRPKTQGTDNVKQEILNKFAQATGKGDVAKMKELYTEVKNSPFPESTKTEMLSSMGSAIKAKQGK